MRKITTLLFCLLYSFSLYAAWEPRIEQVKHHFVPELSNQVFRDQIIKFIRAAAIAQNTETPQSRLNDLDATWSNPYQKMDWSVKITVYHQGKPVGKGCANGARLTDTLKKATALALDHQAADKLTSEQLKQYRFKVDFDYYPAKIYSFIEYNDQGLELVGSRVAVRRLDTKVVAQQIKNSERYLLETMHPQLHGFFKFYDAREDKQESLLRTIYSSSSLYTLLKLYALNKNPQLQQKFKSIADFILSNQVTEGPNAGGFYYGFDPNTNQKTCVVVVGTTSKTIFTLLELAQLYHDEPKYLQSAKKAGDWLLTMVEQDGRVKPIARCDHGGWQYNEKQSFLYSGQVLSALSRLYAVTQDKRYYQGAARIANRFVDLVKTQGPLVGDNYRPANSISTSWLMMSLIDFAKVDNALIYRDTIQHVGSKILSRQITNRDDLYNNGRYLDAMSASGNGWINEVMGVFYEFCNSNHLANCQQYKQAIILSSRWLLQNAYTKENTYNVKNPARAIGGFITNFRTQTVRTDAVCHGVNSLISLLAIAGPQEQILLELPERPLSEVLPLLRNGNGFM